MIPPKVKLHRLLVVMNPISGDIDKAEIPAQIREIAEEHGCVATVFETDGNSDLARLKEHLPTVAYDAVVAAGGDGTVSLVAQALAGQRVPMGIVPLGSGNGLSKDLNIAQEPEAAIRQLWHHRVRALDTLQVSGHFAAHLADLGFNALIVDRFTEGESRGPAAYVKVALQEYLNYEPAYYRITTDADTWEGEAFMLTIANARTFGSNVVINPDSHMDDGHFELCLIAPFSAAAAPGILYQLYTNAFDESAYTTRLRCQQARIEVVGQQEVLVQVDGEPLRLPTPIEVTIEPQSLWVLVPDEE